MTETIDILTRFRNTIVQFDDATFVGEVTATIADAWDQSLPELSSDARKLLNDAITHLAAAVNVLHTFGEDNDWPSWDAFLDAVLQAPLATQQVMVQELAQLVTADAWLKDVHSLHKHTDFAKVGASLAHAAEAAARTLAVK